MAERYLYAQGTRTGMWRLRREVCTDLSDELLAALAIGWQPHVLHADSDDSEEDKSMTVFPHEGWGVARVDSTKEGG